MAEGGESVERKSTGAADRAAMKEVLMLAEASGSESWQRSARRESWRKPGRKMC